MAKKKSKKQSQGKAKQSPDKEVSKASNITPLRKAVREASHIFGQVVVGPNGETERLPIMKGALQDFLKKENRDKHPTKFQYRAVGDSIFLGEEPQVAKFIETLAKQIAPELKKHGIDTIQEHELQEAAEVFQRTLGEIASSKKKKAAKGKKAQAAAE